MQAHSGAAVNEELVLRLLLVRDLLASGADRAASPLPIDRMASVLSTDQAMELLLRTVLPAVGDHPSREDNLPKMMGKLCEARPELISYRDPLGVLRRLRDRVQHDGIIPSLEDARRYATLAEFAFREIAQETVGVSPDELTLARLVQNENIKTNLLKAEAALARSEASEACTAAATAFAQAKGRLIEVVYGRGRVYPGAEALREILSVVADAAARAGTGQAGTGGDRELANFRRNFVEKLKQAGYVGADDPLTPLFWPILVAQFGLALGDLIRFEDTAPKVFLATGGALIQARFRSVPSMEEATFCVGFAVRAALRFEAVAVRVSGAASSPQAQKEDEQAEEGPPNATNPPSS